MKKSNDGTGGSPFNTGGSPIGDGGAPIDTNAPSPIVPEKIGRPKLLDTLTDFGRAAAEYGHFRFNRKAIMASLPKGDGHPVLFLPGFATGDWAMKGMRDTFRELGYFVHGWKCGTNTGPSDALLENLRSRFEALSEKHNGAKISIVGWSLGGIYARELARAYPDKVRCVVTLGTPFGAGHHPDSVDVVVRKVFEALNPASAFLNDEQLQQQALMPPPSVPTSSLYSQGDGVVHWKTCINPQTRLSENIDITPSNPLGTKASASHSGLTINAAVAVILADRLKASGEKPWKRFDANKHPHPQMRGWVAVRQGHEDFMPEPEKSLKSRASHPTIFPKQG